jgi:hypothetical protein
MRSQFFLLSLVLANATIPYWSAPLPNHTLPFDGYTPVANASWKLIYNATGEFGLYTHAPMLDYFAGQFTASFKSSPVHEDDPGQRILVSQSPDGVSWSSVMELFPNVSTTSNPAALFAEPFIHINGNHYAAASPIQFCLYPDISYSSVLLLRQVLPGVANFGPLFWANTSIPSGFEEASSLRNIVAVTGMPQYVQNDIAILFGDYSTLPCADPTFKDNLKCEACYNGCQDWSVPKAAGLANERSHFLIPTSQETDMIDTLFYRCNKVNCSNYLWVSQRNQDKNTSTNEWSLPVKTTILNNNNLHTGTLPDGRIFLLNNLMDRDPLIISTSTDGINFDNAKVALSCDQIGGVCKPMSEKGRGGDVSYPQAVALTAPSNLAALWVIVSNNKQEIYMLRLDYANI